MKRLIAMLTPFLVAALLFGMLPVASVNAIDNGFIQNGYTYTNGLWWKNGIGYRGYRTCNGWTYKPEAYNQHRTSSSSYNASDQSITLTNTNTYILQQSAAPQGSTVYGGSGFATLPYQFMDRDAVINGYTRTIEQGQEGWSIAVSEGTAADVEVARLNAKVALLTALDSDTSTAQSQFNVQIEGRNGNINGIRPSAPTLPSIPPDTVEPNPDRPYRPVDAEDALFNLLEAKCASCHSGENIKGNLDLSDWNDFDLPRKRAILLRCQTNDLSKRMPRNPDGSVGPALNARELGIIALDIVNSAQE